MPFRRRKARPLLTPEQLEAVLGALGGLSRTSLQYLRLITGIAEPVPAECVSRLGADGLLTAEDRSDGNEPRRMVEITAAGRRALETRGGTA